MKLVYYFEEFLFWSNHDLNLKIFKLKAIPTISPEYLTENNNFTNFEYEYIEVQSI